MHRQEVKFWIEEHVTKVFADLVREHREALVDTLVNEKWEATQIGLMNQIKGQINALDMILDIDSFLEEKITKEVIENEDDET